jgi:two-component system sensor histidine kinase MtrB
VTEGDADRPTDSPGMAQRFERSLAPVVEWSKDLGGTLGHVWRRSLQLRVIVSTLTLSLIVITILGVVLTSQLTDRLIDAKISAAEEEMVRARNTVESQLVGVHDIGTQQQRMLDARNALSSRGGTGQSSSVAGSFDAALSIVSGTPQQQISVGPINEVPEELRRFVARNQVSYQFATVSDPDGFRGRSLIIGSPSAEIPTLQIYLVFPLSSEERSLSLMRGTMMIGGIVLLVLLAAITALVTRQVVLPIRSAARIAGRFADGRLKERMLVRGEDDMARLAQAFNEMAESLSNQITQLEEFGNLQRPRSGPGAQLGAAGHRARPIRGFAQRSARDQPSRRRRRRTPDRIARPAHVRTGRDLDGAASGEGIRCRGRHRHAGGPAGRRGRSAPSRAGAA